MTDFAFENFVVTPIFLEEGLLKNRTLEFLMEKFGVNLSEEPNYLNTITQMLDRTIENVKGDWKRALQLATDPRSIVSPFVRLMTIIVDQP
ncbi:MAG: hypothetical protein D6732_25150 [Methanobacteriota archaeon]|nr:MAG: hypothetical protein D6732_25150 [Euryarchaeota archaeon]